MCTGCTNIILYTRGDYLNDYCYYITPKEYEIAESNGISKDTLEIRVRRLGWRKNKAITTPTQKRRHNDKYVIIAKENGIDSRYFWKRVSRGMTLEQAATTPVKTRRECIEKLNKGKHKYPKDVVKKAFDNGICYSTLVYRVNNGMTLEEASTKPITSNYEKGILGSIKRSKTNNYFRKSNSIYFNKIKE